MSVYHPTPVTFVFEVLPDELFPYFFYAKAGPIPLVLFRGEGNPFDSVFEWCHEQFGKGYNCKSMNAPKGTRWIVLRHRGFFFRREEDAFAFRMRWC